MRHHLDACDLYEAAGHTHVPIPIEEVRRMATGRQIKVGRGSVKDGKFKPSDSTSRPLRKGKHAKADRAAKAWLKKSQKAKP